MIVTCELFRSFSPITKQKADTCNLTTEPHTKALSCSCFYHIRSFKQIRSSLDDGMAISVASAMVSLRLDQVNSILYGAASKHINRLQRV